MQSVITVILEQQDPPAPRTPSLVEPTLALGRTCRAFALSRPSSVSMTFRFFLSVVPSSHKVLNFLCFLCIATQFSGLLDPSAPLVPLSPELLWFPSR